ncbi:intersectin-EH binding protein Ibp1 [Mycobacterium sp. NPDC048908]|uniref:intersectin-EH binding protein Ibp1 n=1 Tax=Mycobacterium sp. NPDC048908 TaxID=3364292 RepID=UPI00371FC75D
MTTDLTPTRRLLLTGGFAVAIAVTPAVVAIAHPTQTTDLKPVAACSDGEEEDVFTASCTPFLVPNSPEGFTSTAANPDIPEIAGVPCLGGRSSGACIGLAEDEAAAGPQPVPRSTIEASP